MLLAPCFACHSVAQLPEDVVAVLPTSAIDPETGIPDLIRRLTDDSKRLAADEFRLAKLELHESVHTGIRGAIWLGVALAVSIVAMVALTVVLISAIGAIAGENYWAGALIVGAAESVAGWVLVRRGLGAVKRAEVTLPESRASLADAATWVRHPARH
jgi:uncharacterized membrane protein YqjE